MATIYLSLHRSVQNLKRTRVRVPYREQNFINQHLKLRATLQVYDLHIIFGRSIFNYDCKI